MKKEEGACGCNGKKKEEFYDMKLKKTVLAPVTEKVVYEKSGKGRYMLKGTTEDGRTLCKFVNKNTYDQF